MADAESFNVNITNVTDDLCVLGIAGPKSGELLSQTSGLSADDWKFLDSKQVIDIVLQNTFEKRLRDVFSNPLYKTDLNWGSGNERSENLLHRRTWLGIVHGQVRNAPGVPGTYGKR